MDFREIHVKADVLIIAEEAREPWPRPGQGSGPLARGTGL